MKLSKVLLEQDYHKFESKAEKLAQELRDAYKMGKYDLYVTMGQYQGRDRGFGKVHFNKEGTFSDAEWRSMKNFIEAKEYEITQEENYYEVDPGERTYKPYFGFEFDIVEIDEEIDNPTDKLITPDKAFKLYKFLSNKLGDSFTSEFPLKSDFYFQLEKAGL